MKPIILTAGWILMLSASFQSPGQSNQLPDVDIFTLGGERITANSISNDGMPLILVFFKTFEKKAVDNLTDITEAYHSQLADKGVKMIAICIDCIGKTEHVKPFVFGRDLDIEVFVDKNGNLKRAMGISNSPYTILYDKEMEVYCRYNGYCAAAGDLVCEKMKDCLNKMDLTSNP